MKIRIVHTLRADRLYGVRIKTYRVSVLGTYMISRYMLKLNEYLITNIEIIYIIL